MPPLSSTSPSPSSSRQPVAPAATAWAAGQRQCWDRIGLGVRLAYNPNQPQVARLWLALGDHLVAQGVLGEREAPQRALTILLQVAHDEGLPAFWRSVCLEYTAWPLARLHALSRRQGQPLALEGPGLHAAVLAEHAMFALPAQRPAP